ncbi:MAG: hypothetical protein KTR28_08380, partial [Micavibrio sp.]|nr:hypothetical protein [Micavibrio sp.]
MGKKIDTNQSHTAKSSTHAAINDPAEIGSSKKQSKNRANPQSGNVFFTLFGAVAVVGVLGAGIMSTMRGPLSTMVDVNKIEQTKSEMRVGLGILLQDATDQDTDALTEPKEPSNCGGDPVSCVPNDVASPKTDPWGNSYRYCAWNNGSDATTIGANNLILAGGSAATNIAVAMVSAGPDGVFQNNCLDSSNGLNSYIKTQSEAAGDDLVVAMTYTEAVSGSGGLWTASTSGGDNVATINQDLDLTGSTAAGYSSVQLKLGAASMLLPDSTAIPNCTSGNADLVRINKTVTPFRIENCYWNGTVGTWVAGAQIWSTGTGDDIYYNTGTPQVGIGTATPDDTLDVVGTAQITGASVLGSTLNVTGDYTSVAGDINAVDGTFSGAVSGASGTFTGAGTGLSVTNNANIGGTLGAGASTLASLIVTGTSNLQGDVSDSLGDFTIADTAVITGATTLQSTLDIQGTISNSTGTDPVTIGDTLSVTDVATFSGAGNGLIVSNNADIDGTLEADEYTWGGVDFTPPSTCTDADEKLYWDATSGWLCHNIGSNGDGDGLDISANVLNDLSDVDTSPSDGDCLVFDTTPDPDEWVSVPCSTAAATIWEEFENGASDIIRLSDSGNYATDDFVFGSSQLDDIDGDSDDDIRMFFDKSKGAFRAGNASNDGHNAWNASSANVGDGSVAFGNNTLASGTNSMSWGIRNSGGQGAIGDNSTAFGYRTGALGDGSTAWGSGTFATGYFSTAFGSQVIAGSGTADATNTNGAGHGHHSIAIGMQSNNHTTKPIITGDRTMGIFFDQHTFDSNSTYDLTPDDTFALIGGQFMIGATEAAGAGQACLRYNSGDSTLEYTDDCTGTPTWTSFTNDISGLWTDLTGGRIHYGTTSANQVG